MRSGGVKFLAWGEWFEGWVECPIRERLMGGCSLDIMFIKSVVMSWWLKMKVCCGRWSIVRKGEVCT